MMIEEINELISVITNLLERIVVFPGNHWLPMSAIRFRGVPSVRFTTADRCVPLLEFHNGYTIAFYDGQVNFASQNLQVS